MVLSGYQKLSHPSSPLCGEEPYSEEGSNPHESLSRQSRAEYDPGYGARVDFALKLGYTEDLVQTALSKLGPNPSHNELLAELIKLGAQVPTSFIQDNEQDMSFPQAKLRPIVIDGSNVAMSHGNKELFSCVGIKLCVDWFRSRGHREITVFVPKWRKESCRPDNLIKNQEVLAELEKDRVLVYTPSRLIGGKRLVCYDDRFILRLAADTDGVVVSNDNYRDLCLESPDFRKVVEDRILMYSFVNDRFMPPEDPLGRSGPPLDKFLTLDYKQNSTGAPCPYGRKCTYGGKCKFSHPERGPWPHKTVTERLMEHAQKQMSEKRQINKTLSCPAVPNQHQTQLQTHPQKTLLSRTRSYAPEETRHNEQSLHAGNFSNMSHSMSNMSNGMSGMANGMSGMSNGLSGSMANGMSGNMSNGLSGSMSNGMSGSMANGMSNHMTNGMSQGASGDQTGPLHQRLQRQLSLNPYEERPQNGQNHNGSLSSLHVRNGVQNGHGPNHVQNGHTSNGSQNGSLNGHHTGHPERLRSPYEDISQKERMRLHYHLASLFPEDQVIAAMQVHPNETSAHVLCASILAMFPPSR